MVVQKIAFCKKCSKGSIQLKVVKRVGLSATIEAACSDCDHSEKCSNSKRRLYNFNGESRYFDSMNLAFLNASRIAGIGKAAASQFCKFMNLPSPPHAWCAHQSILGFLFKKRAELSMGQGLKDCHQLSIASGGSGLHVSGDGSWQKRGRTSLFGLVSLICMYTNRIVGVDVLSKYCQKCKGKGCPSDANCGINYQGSSGGMEVDGLVNAIRSIYDKYGYQVTKYLSDGDSRAYKKACEVFEWSIEKLECVNHFSKRLGTRLRNAIQHSRPRVDGRFKRSRLSGKGKLTNKAVDRLQSYFGFVIRQSCNVDEMRRSIQALYNHVSSSDDNPMHDLCSLQYCKFLQAQETNTVYKHKGHFHLPSEIMEHIKKDFDDLSGNELLKKVTHGKTQNANECFNSTVWNLLSKNGFASFELLSYAVSLAVCKYNEGNLPVIDVLKYLGFPIGKSMVKGCQTSDSLRVSKKRKADVSKVQRSANKRLRNKSKPGDDLDYAPGAF